MFRSRTHTRTLPSSPGAASLQPLQGAHGTLLVAQLHKVLASPGTPRPCLCQPQHPQVLLKDGACPGEGTGIPDAQERLTPSPPWVSVTALQNFPMAKG